MAFSDLLQQKMLRKYDFIFKNDSLGLPKRENFGLFVCLSLYSTTCHPAG